MKLMKNYAFSLFLIFSFAPTITASDFSKLIGAIHQNLISEVTKIEVAITDLCDMDDHENAREMLTTGLSLTLKFACSKPEMDDDIVIQELGAYYEEFVSLGNDVTNFNKKKFIFT